MAFSGICGKTSPSVFVQNDIAHMKYRLLYRAMCPIEEKYFLKKKKKKKKNPNSVNCFVVNSN